MYDSAEDNQLIMVMPEKEVLLNEIHNGLYYHDIEDRDLLLVKTVEENQEGFSRREIYGYREDRQMLEMFYYLSQKIFGHIVRTINNCPVVIEDVCNSNKNYGYGVPTLKGKTVRQQPERVQT